MPFKTALILEDMQTCMREMKNTWGNVKVFPADVPDNGVMLSFSSERPILNNSFSLRLWWLLEECLCIIAIKITGSHGMIQFCLNISTSFS